jgi:hypothetical protein
MKNGKYISEDGIEEWYQDGKLHREDGPAIRYADGYEEWYLYGQRHRVDGPAVICSDGKEEWWVNYEKRDNYLDNNKLWLYSSYITNFLIQPIRGII